MNDGDRQARQVPVGELALDPGFEQADGRGDIVLLGQLAFRRDFFPRFLTEDRADQDHADQQSECSPLELSHGKLSFRWMRPDFS